MKKFILDRGKLKSVLNSAKFDQENGCLEITSPEVLATFLGYVKFQIRKYDINSKVFIRGQIKDHNSIVPSLLRKDDKLEFKNMLLAYENLRDNVPKLYKASRFTKERIENIFQHYGIKSPSIDLVDNLLIAVWFATHQWIELSATTCTYKPSENEFGYLYFFKVEANQMDSNNLDGRFIDLGYHHSSLSARLHCQQGSTYFRYSQNYDWMYNNRDFQDMVIAKVKISGKRFLKFSSITQDYLFPSIAIDSTYKYLLRSKFSKLLQDVEHEHSLIMGSLGKIWIYK